MSEHREETAEVAGCRVLMRRAGAGAPLVFLHGAGGTMGFPPSLAKLADRFDVLLPDHPGFGTSDDPPWLEDVGDLAYFYLDLFAALGLERLHLVGHSLGGWIAMELAIRDPARLASLTLVSAAGIDVPDAPKGDSFLWSPQEATKNLVHDQALAERLAAQTPSDDEIFQRLKNRETTVRLAWHPRFENPRLAKWLRRIALPTHIVWGREDKLFPVAHAAALQSLIPQATVTILDECGHLPHLEQPERFAADVARFIGGVRS